jgi:transmembrane sensor
MRTDRDSAADRERAWALLAAVEDHPRVQEWLRAPAVRRTHIYVYVRWAAAAVIVAAIGLAFAAAYLQIRPVQYETAVSEQRDVLLADGSRVTLNTDTALTVRYAASSRLVELERGEAIFAVKHDAARPFEVIAGQTVTRALGTEFNVDLRSDRIRVSVIEGVVRVSAAADDGTSKARPLVPALTKGRSAEFRDDDNRIVEAAADLQRIQAWRARRLEFSDTPLPEALEEFNRYSTAHVVIGTADLNTVRVSGVFRIGDTEGFLFSLREALGVQTLATQEEIVLLRAGN